jgi:hypothetical protein
MPPERMTSATKAAWAVVLVTVLGTAFLLYGRFAVLERRMEDSDRNQHELIKQVAEIAQQLDRIEAWIRARAR